MNCPYCGREMESGVIPTVNAYSVLWIPVSSYKTWFTHDMETINRLNGVVLREKAFLLRDRKMDAMLCRNCRKVILSYEDGLQTLM